MKLKTSLFLQVLPAPQKILKATLSMSFLLVAANTFAQTPVNTQTKSPERAKSQEPAQPKAQVASPVSREESFTDKQWRALQNYYFMMTGVELSSFNPKFDLYKSLAQKLTNADLQSKTNSENWQKIAEAVTNDYNFQRVTLADFAARMSNLEGLTNQPLGDLQIMMMEFFKRDVDYRSILFAPYAVSTYKGAYNGVNANDVTFVRNDDDNYTAHFYKTEDVRSYGNSGIITTNEFAEKFLKDGTNRRPIKYLMENFMCSPMASIKDYSISDKYVGVDITRSPGADPSKYQSDCRGCHSWMDGMRGAFAYSNYVNNKYQVQSSVFEKMNHNLFTAPNGFKVTDDRWEIYSDWADRPSLGINALKGRGYSELGRALADSEGFDSCLPRQIIKTVCQKMPSIEEIKENKLLLSDHNYSLKQVTQAASLSPLCSSYIEQGKKIKTFRAVGMSLINSLRYQGYAPYANAGTVGRGGTREMFTFEPSKISALPQLGLPSEVGASTLAALQSKASMLCDRMSDAYINADVGGKALPAAAVRSILVDFQEKLYGQPLDSSEVEKINRYIERAYAVNFKPGVSGAVSTYCSYGILGNPKFLTNPYGGAK